MAFDDTFRFRNVMGDRKVRNRKGVLQMRNVRKITVRIYVPVASTLFHKTLRPSNQISSTFKFKLFEALSKIT